MPERDRSHPQPEAASTPRAATRAERAELLDHLTAALEPAMAALGLVFLALLLVDYAAWDLGGRAGWVDGALQVVWVIFLAEFLLRFAVAPEKGRFLRANWLSAISLALPFLRPLRALRAVRALRSLSLVRLLGGVNRGMRVLRRVTGGRRVAYVGALTVFVILAGAVGVLSFDRGAEGATITTFGDAVWWAAALVTTINSGQEAVTPEARVVAFLLRLYAVSVFGYITASIATYLIGRDAEERAEPAPTADGVASELAGLRQEVAALRRDLAALRGASVPDGSAADQARPWTPMVAGAANREAGADDA